MAPRRSSRASAKPTSLRCWLSRRSSSASRLPPRKSRSSRLLFQGPGILLRRREAQPPVERRHRNDSLFNTSRETKRARVRFGIGTLHARQIDISAGSNKLLSEHLSQRAPAVPVSFELILAPGEKRDQLSNRSAGRVTRQR
jgi:hypothetical protein